MDKWSDFNGCIFKKILGCESLEKSNRKETSTQQETRSEPAGKGSTTTKEESSIMWIESPVEMVHAKSGLLSLLKVWTASAENHLQITTRLHP